MNSKNYNNLSEKMIKKKKIIFRIYLISLILLSLSYLIYSSYNTQYLIGLIIFIPFYFLAFKLYLNYKEMKNILKLKKRWGKKINRKINFEEIRKLFDYIIDYDKKEIFVDDQSWHDLNMNAIYKEVDQTLSNPGEKVLYNFLRHPLFDKKEIKRRNNLIKNFQDNKNLRNQTGIKLLNLGRRKRSDLLQLIYNDIPSPTPYGFLLNILAVLSIGAIASFFFVGVKGIFILALIMAINAGVRKIFKKKFFDKLPANTIDYLGAIIKTAEEISELKVTGINDYQNELKSLTNKVSNLKKKMNSFIPNKVKSEADYLFAYLNILFLIDVRNFNSSLKEINENYIELRKIYNLVGELDAFRSIASYRETLDYYSFPHLNANNKNYLKIDKAYHPLLDNPVPNSIELDNKGILITGSNMAGKSTFLRTIGINTLFSQTIATSPAKNYQGTMFKVVTSISRTDNIIKGKSFYFSEAERLLKLINTIKDDKPALCIVDELLSGTNSLERFHAAHEILDYLNKNSVLTITATHDLNLADSLENKFSCYYFNDNVSKDGLDFDYKLKKGTAVNGNAIKLLQYLDYPEEITEKAFEKITTITD